MTGLSRGGLDEFVNPSKPIEPHYEDGGLRVWHGKNMDVLPHFADATFDSIVTDPPYELGFMGKGWDSTGIAYDVEVWRECLRVLKPGGHLLAFGGSRTWHRIAAAIEDAGFEVRDSIAWLYGSGFPKSMDVAKAIDKMRDDTADVRVICRWLRAHIEEHPTLTVRAIADSFGFHPRMVEHWAARDSDSQPSLPTLTQWDILRGALGFGSEMDAEVYRLNMRKGEPGEAWADREIVGTVEEWKDRTRIEGTKPDTTRGGSVKRSSMSGALGAQGRIEDDGRGRWPTNVVLDDSQAASLDAQSGVLTSGKLAAHHSRAPKEAGILGAYGAAEGERGYGDSGGASRFFPTFSMTAEDWAWEARVQSLPTFRYEAKAPTSERPEVDGTVHATVKPLELMRWLVRLVTRPGGRVGDIYAGSGTTGEAALLEGMECDLIEMEADHLPLILARVRKPLAPALFGDWGAIA